MEQVALSVREAAKALGVSRDMIFVLTRSGQLRSFRIGHRRLIPADAIREFVERQTREPEPVAAGQ